MYSKLFALLLLAPLVCFGQEEKKVATDISLDLLRAPSSPASILSGISPSEIEKPTDVSSFMVSLQQATNNFTQLPKSYAIDFAPGLLFNSRNLTIDRFIKNDLKSNFIQSFTISAAFRNLEAGEEDDLSLQKTKIGLGFKFSLLRGKLNRVSGNLLTSIVKMQKALLNRLVNGLGPLIDSDSIIKSADEEMETLARAGKKDSQEFKDAQQKGEDREEALKTEVLNSNKEALDRLTALGLDFKTTKVGLKIDVAGGLVIDFLESTFNKSYVTKGGAWVTGGYESETGWSFLGIGRYLFNPDKILADDLGVIKSADIGTFDAGGRIIFSSPKSKFSLSSEAIYRSVLNNDDVGSTWRFTMNADYDLGSNRKLTVAFGRDFDGTVSKSGNVIAALNFLAGFGNRKKVDNSSLQ